jgi:predicted enzyme related to lactoylglutathione lyase
MRRAVSFYGELLDMELHAMRLGPNDYAIFSCTSSQNTGALVEGGGSTPSDEGVVIYLNGGKDLSGVLRRVEKAGGKVLLEKTFLSKEAGHIAYFADTEGNRIGLHSME